jgi:MHS family proline/betaine transporter-like MFS transporter
VVGHIGDRLGRRTALTFSVAVMAVPTFLIGLLPGYATLGVAAPVLFTLLRMMQGLSTGGEYTSSLVFLVERAPPGRRGLTAAFGPFGAILGVLLGSAMGWLFAAVMSPDALADWGWRIPFLLGLGVGLAGFFLRRNMPELPRTEQRERAPLAEVFRDHWRLLITLAAFSVFTGVGFYVAFVYVASWLQSVDHMPLSRALEINTLSMCLMPPIFLVSAWLSDRYGRKPLLLISTIAGFFAAVPLFLLMEHPGPLFRAPRTDRLDPDRRRLYRRAGREHGRDRPAAGALHRGGTRLQHRPGRHRRPDPARRDLAGAANRR